MLACLTRDTRNSLSPRSMMATDRLRASRAIEQKKREMGDEAKEGLLVRMLALRIQTRCFAIYFSFVTPPPPLPLSFFSLSPSLERTRRILPASKSLRVSE